MHTTVYPIFPRAQIVLLYNQGKKITKTSIVGVKYHKTIPTNRTREKFTEKWKKTLQLSK